MIAKTIKQNASPNNVTIRKSVTKIRNKCAMFGLTESQAMNSSVDGSSTRAHILVKNAGTLLTPISEAESITWHKIPILDHTRTESANIYGLRRIIPIGSPLTLMKWVLRIRVAIPFILYHFTGSQIHS